MSQCDGLIVCQIGDQFCIDVIAAEASGRLDQFIAGNLVIIPVGASSEITELLQTECCTESVAAAARYNLSPNCFFLVGGGVTEK